MHLRSSQRIVMRCVVFALALVFAACAGQPLAPPTPEAPPLVSPPPRAAPPPATPAEPNAPAPEIVKSDEGAPARARDRSLVAFPVFTNPGDLPSLAIVDPERREAERAKVPLKNTRVLAKLSQFVAEVEVTQRYENSSTRPIEAVYVFPLPENAAVNAMKMTVGERVIVGKIDERTRARTTYERAKRAGHTAALVEEERPNVFTQSVANIEPGKPIEVTIRYVQELSYDAGVHELVFPMVVGPRFVQGGALARGDIGTGTARDTDMVPDASRISPPYVGQGERSGRDIEIEVVTQPDLFIGDIEPVTHDMVKATGDDGELHLKLAKHDRLPNRDFVLRYRVAGERPRATMLTSEGDGFFSLVVDPPDLDVDGLVGKREIVFVVDVSGSMAGVPITLCKRAMELALGKIRPVDTFNVITFAGATQKLFRSSRPANDENIQRATAFIDAMRAGGGTMMLDAVEEALSPDVEAGRDRYVFFLTDGMVGVDDQILASTRTFVAAMEKKGRRARVFGFGVGSSPNRSLIEGMSREGKGVPVYATNREDPARGVNQFFRYIDRSVLRDVSIDWGGAKVSDVSPEALPDLFASHPLIVHGRLGSSPSRKPVLHATTAAGAIEIPVQVVALKKGAPRSVLGVTWARSRIATLETDLQLGDRSARDTIEKLGLDFQIVTPFTSFVAVDRGSRTEGPSTQVLVPQESPEDVNLPLSGVGQGELSAMDEGRRSVRLSAEPDAPASIDGRHGACACTLVGAEPAASRTDLGVWLAAALVLTVAKRRRRCPSARR